MTREIKTIRYGVIHIVFRILFFGYFLRKLIIHSFIEVEKESIYSNTIIQWLMGIALAIYFINILINIGRYFRKERIGLRIYEEGIMDCITLKEIGTILWEDIELVSIKNNIINSFLIVKMKSPSDYINKANQNFELKNILRKNNAKYQTPIVINITDLDIEHKELRDLIRLRLKEVKQLSDIGNNT